MPFVRFTKWRHCCSGGSGPAGVGSPSGTLTAWCRCGALALDGWVGDWAGAEVLQPSGCVPPSGAGGAVLLPEALVVLWCWAMNGGFMVLCCICTGCLCKGWLQAARRAAWGDCAAWCIVLRFRSG